MEELIGEGYILNLNLEDVTSKSWIKKAQEWGCSSLIPVISPESHNKEGLAGIAESMINRNGSYAMGDRVIINTLPQSSAMACEIALLLKTKNIDSIIILDPAGIMGEAGEGISDMEIKNPRHLAKAHNELVNPISQKRNYHIIDIQVAVSPERTDNQYVLQHIYARKKAGSKLYGLLCEGYLKSYDTLPYLTDQAFCSLDEQLPNKERRVGKAEWENMIKKLPYVAGSTLKKRAIKSEMVNMLIDASVTGSETIEYKYQNSKITFSVSQMPVILDSGVVGNNSLRKTTPFEYRMTNPLGGVVFAPIVSGSADGTLRFECNMRTPLGLIEGPYDISIVDGKVEMVSAKRGESEKILRHYTGLEHYYRKNMAGKKLEAFQIRRSLSKIAVGCFNQGLNRLIREEKLIPATGLRTIDEKLGMAHWGFGRNIEFGGDIGYKSNYLVGQFSFVQASHGTMRLV
ncbi:hypothetical protein KY358_05740 [Candidatus Woesearchaeota archaeon]|nr:hypothetical protein [Candidatus Woesearchaeota archaeon]